MKIDAAPRSNHARVDPPPRRNQHTPNKKVSTHALHRRKSAERPPRPARLQLTQTNLANHVPGGRRATPNDPTPTYRTKTPCVRRMGKRGRRGKIKSLIPNRGGEGGLLFTHASPR